MESGAPSQQKMQILETSTALGSSLTWGGGDNHVILSPTTQCIVLLVSISSILPSQESSTSGSSEKESVSLPLISLFHK